MQVNFEIPWTSSLHAWVFSQTIYKLIQYKLIDDWFKENMDDKYKHESTYKQNQEDFFKKNSIEMIINWMNPVTRDSVHEFN